MRGFYRYGLLFVLAGLLLGGHGVQAAGAPWQAWLYENEIGRLTKVDDAGTTLQQLLLPAEPGSSYSYYASISPDGRYAAYSTKNYASGQGVLTLVDLVTQSAIWSFPVLAEAYTSLEFESTPFAFDETSQNFAFGYAHPSVNWQLNVVNLLTLNMTSVAAGSPAATSAGLESGFGYLVPVVRQFRNGVVSFTQVAAATDGAPFWSAYNWHIASGSFSPNNFFTSLDSTTLPLNNETILTYSDPTLPNHVWGESGFPRGNSLIAYNAQQSVSYSVFGGQYVYHPVYVQNGERVAFVSEVPAAGQTFWQVLDRSGTLVGTVSNYPVDFITNAVGTLNGWLFAVGSSGDSGGTTLYYVETRLAAGNLQAVSVWNSALGANARVIWSTDLSSQGLGAALGNWAVFNPAAAAPSPSILAVGGVARVQTTDGDTLNVRSGAGTRFARLGTLSNGAVVTLEEGPISADGFLWWRVTVQGSGLQGWVVESAEGVQTLLPSG